MGKIVLITGPNGSGKSVFAESLIAKTQGERFYLATMQDQDGYNQQRIEKHRRQRAGLGFTTIEEPFSVAAAPVSPESVVLLEDASNLLANNIFEKHGSGDAVLQDILQLARRCRALYIVAITGLSAEGYDGETASYIHAIDQLNQALAQTADVVVELQQGQPVCVKGALE